MTNLYKAKPRPKFAFVLPFVLPTNGTTLSRARDERMAHPKAKVVSNLF